MEFKLFLKEKGLDEIEESKDLDWLEKVIEWFVQKIVDQRVREYIE